MYRTAGGAEQLAGRLRLPCHVDVILRVHSPRGRCIHRAARRPRRIRWRMRADAGVLMRTRSAACGVN